MAGELLLPWNSRPVGVAEALVSKDFGGLPTEVHAASSWTPGVVFTGSAGRIVGADGIAFNSPRTTQVSIPGVGNWNGPDTQRGTLVLRIKVNGIDSPWGTFFQKWNATVWRMLLQRYTSSNTLAFNLPGNAVTFPTHSISGMIDGKYHTLVITLENVGSALTRAILYDNGVKYSASGNITAWIPGNIVGQTILGSNDPTYSSDVEVSSYAYYNGWVASEAEVKRLASVPWQLLSPYSIPISGTRRPAITLTVGSDTETNTSSTSVITGNHILVGANSTETNTSSTGVITGNHVLVGANSTQDNLSLSGSIAGSSLLVAATSDETNSSSTGTINQIHIIVGANSSETNTNSTGVITGNHIIVGANSSSTNATSTGSITQQHNIVAASSIETNTASTNVILQVQVFVGSTSTETNNSGSVAVSLVYTLIAASSNSTNTSLIGTISQSHNILASSTTNVTLSSTSIISQLQQLIGSSVVQINNSLANSLISSSYVEGVYIYVNETPIFIEGVSKDIVVQSGYSDISIYDSLTSEQDEHYVIPEIINRKVR